MKEIAFKPIGIIRTPFKKPKGTPIQASGARGVRGQAEILPEYAAGLKDLEGFSHVILIYHFHLAKTTRLSSKPFLDDEAHGIFAIRAPSRPNPIGISTVRLEKIRENVLYFQDVDIVDGTPLLDIKPYVPEFDGRKDSKVGWLRGKLKKLPRAKDDGRFSKK